MKTVILVGIFAAVVNLASGAALRDDELYENQYEDYARMAPSYGTQYVSPCAAAAAGALHYPHPHYQGYGSQYNAPRYRSVDQQLDETLEFSDSDFQHLPMARLGGVSSLGGSVLTSGAPGSAYGVFPNANGGGCSVPLLFSCTPTIVSGHMMPQGYQHGPGPQAYRLVDETHAVQAQELSKQQNTHPLPTSHVA